jgi:hypothetical protein
MKATTIKLEGSILQELEDLKGPDQNMTSFVLDLLRAQIHRRKMGKRPKNTPYFCAITE